MNTAHYTLKAKQSMHTTGQTTVSMNSTGQTMYKHNSSNNACTVPGQTKIRISCSIWFPLILK
jgi:hypothetical protein